MYQRFAHGEKIEPFSPHISVRGENSRIHEVQNPMNHDLRIEEHIIFPDPLPGERMPIHSIHRVIPDPHPGIKWYPVPSFSVLFIRNEISFFLT
jgi:hypothetical protein